MSVQRTLIILSIFAIALYGFEALETDLTDYQSSDESVSHSDTESDSEEDVDLEGDLKDCVTQAHIERPIGDKSLDLPYFNAEAMNKCWNDYEEGGDELDIEDIGDEDKPSSKIISVTVGVVIEQRMWNKLGKEAAGDDVDKMFQKANHIFKSCCSKLTNRDKELKIFLKPAYKIFAENNVISAPFGGKLDKDTAAAKASEWAKNIKEKQKAVDVIAVFSGLDADRTSGWYGLAYAGGACDNGMNSIVVLNVKNAYLVLAHEIGHTLGVENHIDGAEGRIMRGKGLEKIDAWEGPVKCCQRVCDQKRGREECKFLAKRCGSAWCPCKKWDIPSMEICGEKNLMEEFCTIEKDDCDALKDSTGTPYKCAKKKHHCTSKTLKESEIHKDKLEKYCPKLKKHCVAKEGTFSCDGEYSVIHECPRNKGKYLGRECEKKIKEEVFHQGDLSISVEVPYLECKTGSEFGEAWSKQATKLIKAWVLKNRSSKKGGCLNRVEVDE